MFEATGTGVEVDDEEVDVVGAGVGLCVEDALDWDTSTPLLQTNFLPDLIQVYFLP